MAVVLLAGCGSPAPQPAPPPSAAAESPPAPQSATLERVRGRKRLRCGVTDGLPGFAERNLTGQWRGFDVDLCRAVAAAVLGESRAVSIVPLSSRTRYAALQSGAVDMVAGGASYTFTHDAALGLDFVGVSYFDALGFLTAAPKSKPLTGALIASPVATMADLNGGRICVQGGSAAQQALAEVFRVRGFSYRPIVKDDRQQALAAYARGQCDAVADDLSVLAVDRASLRRPDASTILSDTLADDPLGLMVREGDDRWADVVRWTLNALVLAEADKLTSGNVEQARQDSVDPDVRRLLGLEGEAGRRLGLDNDWALRAIALVGAYGQIFDRNLGAPLKLERGRNALWTADRPGLLYAPPLR
jgi:general L-amino acid transport system substrate-binding protein